MYYYDLNIGSTLLLGHEQRQTKLRYQASRASDGFCR
jgi:hypothetical protein